MEIKRVWSMPNSRTFSIEPIGKFVKKYTDGKRMVVDPFANESKIANITNDLNPDYATDYHMDALDFLKMFPDESIDVVIYDPPYSIRQVSECYKNFGKEVTSEKTSFSWRKKHMEEIKRILKKGGYCLCFGWNSNGVGKNRGFELEEILLIAHGGGRNDTICTAERKYT